MAVAQAGVKVEIEFGSYGADVWTDVTADVRQRQGVRIKRGISGTGPKDKVARVGTATFALNNSGTNSGGLTGYYSPDHANLRSGFRIGRRVRISLVAAGVATTKFIGTIDAIRPEPGAKRNRTVFVSCVDWLEEAARWRLRNIPIQTNKRGDELIDTVLDEMPRAAFAPTTEFGAGQSTFVYALDNGRDESQVALQEFARATLSEFGYFYLREGAGGERLVFEHRHHRYLGTMLTNAYTFSNSMCEMSVTHAVSNVFNRIEVTAHPRRLGSTDTEVLYTLQGAPSLGPGESTTIRGPFTDPSQRAVRIGSLTTQAVIATTDYTFNSAADGSGVNLTANLTVVAVVSGNSAEFTVTNTGLLSGYITKLQIRGRPIFDYSPVIAEAVDEDSIDAYGERPLRLDMAYQDSPVVAQGAADFLLSQFKEPHTYVDSLTVCANYSDTILADVAAIDIGTRIGIAETVTGLTTAAGYFVQSIDLLIAEAAEVIVTYTVVPATDAADMWRLGVVGASELDDTTVLASF